MQTLPITKQNAIKAYNGADDKGKKLLVSLLGDDIAVSEKITDRVQTFDDILAIKGISIDDLLNGDETKDEAAYKKIKLIAEVYNEGTVMDGRNKSQYKYYPWFEINPNSGFGLSCHDYAFWCSDAVVGSRLCFKSSELATDAGKKFNDIYADYLIN